LEINCEAKAPTRSSAVAGQQYKEQIVASLATRGIPYCVVSFDGFKDVSDYLDARHTGTDLAQLIEVELAKIEGGPISCPKEIPHEETSI